MIFKDYYKILGLDTNRVTLTQIKNAYREQAKKYHPDVNIGNKNSEERFKDINEAYRILSEVSTKRKYDRIWTRNVTTKRTSYSYNSKGDFFTMFFGTVPEDGKPNKANSKAPSKGDNLEAEIRLKVREAYKGTVKDIQMKTASGSIKKIEVIIPSGIKNGEIIRVAGQGRAGKNGGSNGDLLIKAKLISDSEFVLDGANVKKYLNITPWEAALGAKVKVKGIDESISVYIPAGTNSGEIINIENKGYVDKSGNRGNLLLEVKILVPKDCTDKEKELYEELKSVSKFNPRKS